MSFTFKLLKRNDPEIMGFYTKANNIWQEIFDDYKGDSSKLAKTLGTKQISFEMLVQDSGEYTRWDGQEVMVLSGLSYFLDEDSEQNRHFAKTVAEAFEMSYCSIEVKGLAKRVANLFYIGNY